MKVAGSASATSAALWLSNQAITVALDVEINPKDTGKKQQPRVVHSVPSVNKHILCFHVFLRLVLIRSIYGMPYCKQNIHMDIRSLWL